MTGRTGALTLGLWQSSGTPGDVTANLAEVAKAAAQAKAQGVDLLVFPECFLTGYFTDADVAQIAGEVEPALGQLAAIAAQLDMAFVVGSYLPGPMGVQNVALIVTPESGVQAPYAKQMLYGTWEEATFTPGQHPHAFDWRGMRIGVLICFDIEFPEVMRATAALDVDLVVVPTSLMAPAYAVPRLLVPARALENQVFVGYANRIGADAAHSYPGESVIAGPDGAVLANAGGGTELITARILATDVAKARAEFSYLEIIAAKGAS